MLASFELQKYMKNVTDREISAGIEVVQKACLAPLRMIASNSGKSFDVVYNVLLAHNETVNYGWNAKDDVYVNMFDEGILDPVKVTRTALENACSVAITFITLDAVISNCE